MSAERSTARSAGPARKTSEPRKRARTPSRRSQRPRRARRWLWALLSLLAVAVLGPLFIVLWWATRPLPGDGRRLATRFTGTESPAEVGERLARLGLIDSPLLYRIYSGALAPSVAVSPGPHLLSTGLSPRRLLQCLARLPSRPTQRVTIPEGYTHLQLAERLERQGVCAAAEFRATVRNPAVLARLQIAGSSAEGYLFPATYELFLDADPEQIVSQLASETRKRLGRLDDSTGGALGRLREQRGWSERDVLTLASVVERESSAPDERARIASVFYNRLDDPTFRPARRLQSDPTAAYGCAVDGERIPSCAGFRGRVTPEMLRDPANPYNTYRHPGLPPGPIANPGEGSIRAALQPETTEFLYFVLGPDGRHRFGRSFSEHRRAIDEGTEGSLSPDGAKR
jgi:UPF0755 protein